MQDDSKMNRAARAECLKVMEDSTIDVDLSLRELESFFRRDDVDDARKVRAAASRISGWAYRLERAARTLDEEDA